MHKILTEKGIKLCSFAKGDNNIPHTQADKRQKTRRKHQSDIKQ